MESSEGRKQSSQKLKGPKSKTCFAVSVEAENVSYTVCLYAMSHAVSTLRGLERTFLLRPDIQS